MAASSGTAVVEKVRLSFMAVPARFPVLLHERRHLGAWISLMVPSWEPWTRQLARDIDVSNAAPVLEHDPCA